MDTVSGPTTKQLIGSLFIQRRDVKAYQKKTGAYKPIKTPWTLKDIQNHLDGRVTLGHYLVDAEGKTKVIAFDIDFEKTYVLADGSEINPRDVFSDPDNPARGELVRAVRSLADGIAWRLKRLYPSLTVLTAFSGSKGIHVYGCFGGNTSAESAQGVGVSLLKNFAGGDFFIPLRGDNFFQSDVHPNLTIEVFPKQGKIGKDGFGNLMRLPLGINQKTGKAGFFYDPMAPISELNPLDPIEVLLHGSINPKGKK